MTLGTMLCKKGRNSSFFSAPFWLLTGFPDGDGLIHTKEFGRQQFPTRQLIKQRRRNLPCAADLFMRSPNPSGQAKSLPTKEEFESLVERIPWSGCWIWMRCLAANEGRNRYGLMKRGGVKHKAHRYAYQLYRGEIGRGMLVCHSCDIPECCNPEHLFVGTYGDNARDCVAKGRRPKIKDSAPWFPEKMRAVVFANWQRRRGQLPDISL